ncbi:hypothetical protein BC827DRAFT_195021 [Russula dissimulans]|nr:hypothetical protein BC827DRAFT_195021 [Russula dissimulans]
MVWCVCGRSSWLVPSAATGLSTLRWSRLNSVFPCQESLLPNSRQACFAPPGPRSPYAMSFDSFLSLVKCRVQVVLRTPGLLIANSVKCQ